ncbi:class I SAM-dependent methyltransferase [Acholeplasma vituli]|uniref:Class I SAM-dependent methyltransferase n=1 Tax=Paracholeplasma vituli TaxID=69473 RepID=A0ABT2PUP3_9MOLU|nr:class I SAM-dependent methyltransferase [Paracholeplasma vituli]MCU0104670.1 class I SAM-dependent methyltransferase [Paracholeplasma vituli]
MTRIEALSKLTNGIDTLLDIGTDHGYVIIDALEKGYIKQAIACEVNPMPLENARQNIAASGLSDRVHFVLSNGFLNVIKPFDGVLIAGMGMHLIKDILLQPHTKAKKYILQANNHIDQLREFITNNDFRIVDEVSIFEKFHYVILVVEPGIMKLSQKECYIGPFLKNHPESLQYYLNLQRILSSNHMRATGEKKRQIAVKLDYLSEVISDLQK